MAKCELIGITDPITSNMCRQLGCDGYSIAAVATKEDFDRITHKQYGYGNTDTKYQKDVTNFIDNFNNDLISFFSKKVCDYSPASLSYQRSVGRSVEMSEDNSPKKDKNNQENESKVDKNINTNYEAFAMSMDGENGAITVNSERLEKISSLNLPFKQPNYQVLFNVEKEWIAVEDATKWLRKEWDFDKYPCNSALMSTFSHVFDLVWQNFLFVFALWFAFGFWLCVDKFSFEFGFCCVVCLFSVKLKQIIQLIYQRFHIGVVIYVVDFNYLIIIGIH